jgi:class 3 adenylate cyclase
MPRLQAKPFANPDDTRMLSKTRFATVVLDDATVGHCVFEAGWRWSVDVAPLMGVTSCPVRHLGYSMSGSVRVQMDDGRTVDIGPDTAFDVPPGHDKWVLGDEPWETIEWGGSGRAVGAAIQDLGSTLATVLFTDIVDSTAKLHELGDRAWHDLLAAHNSRLREAINVHRGREVKTTGDGILAVFDSPARAVRSAEEMVRAARGLGLEIRVGIHTGDLEVVGDDVRGLAVHTAARILGAAAPSEILLSQTTSALIEGSGIALESAGTHELKGLPEPRQLYRIRDGRSRTF